MDKSDREAGGITLIRSLDWIVAWDEETSQHVYMRDADLAFSGDKIRFVGKNYDGPHDEVINGRDTMLMPGLLNIHTHPDVEPSYRGIREDHGVPEMYMTGLYERVQVYGSDHESQIASAEVAYCEMLLSGVTTVVDLSTPYPGWIALAERSGLRAYLAPGFVSARWKVPRQHVLEYAWDLAAGRSGLDSALQLIDEMAKNPTGRITGMLYPAQIDTCTEDLLRDSLSAAQERNIQLTTHISQSVLEFNEMVHRNGITPIQWAEKIGLLGNQTILGHAIFVDEHSGIRWWTKRDIEILASTNTHVAHCPTTFSRYGQVLENLGRYIHSGINVGIGTDCIPHNMIEEIRCAATLGRVTTGDINAVSSAEMLNAATVGGAKALSRDDIGKIAPGKKADFVLVDLTTPLMQPVRDPWRSLLYSAADRAVRDVFVDGKKVVGDRKVLHLDYSDALERLAAGQARMEAQVPERDPRSRTSLQVSPLSLSMAGNRH